MIPFKQAMNHPISSNDKTAQSCFDILSSTYKINIYYKKRMNNQISLLNKKMSQAQPEKKGSSFKVYIEDSEGNTYSTKLTQDLSTIQDAIIQAIRNFNTNIHAQLPENPQLYELYAAKNGKKDTGLPSFQKTQSIFKVGKERFFLVCLSKDFRLMSNQSLSTIKTISYDIAGETKKKEELGNQKSGFCFCGGW